MSKKDPERKLDDAVAREAAEAAAEASSTTDDATSSQSEFDLDSIIDSDDGAENDIVGAIRAELETARNEAKAHADKYLRLMAEFDNARRRHSRDMDSVRETAAEKLIGDLIDVRENLQRAIANPGADAEKILEGLKLISSKFDGVLASHGLTYFGEVGEAFDPEIHDAMMRQPHDEIAEDHLVQVFEKGYKVKAKVIRHAKVIVSSGKA